MEKRSVIFFILLCFFSLTAGDKKQELFRQLKDAKSQIQTLSHSEGQIAKYIDNLEKQISLLEEIIEELNKDEDSLILLGSALVDSMKLAQGEWERHKSLLSQTLRTMYICGIEDPLTVIFSTQSPNEFSEMIYYLSNMANSRQKKIEIARNAFQNYSLSKKKVEKNREELLMTRTEKQKKLSELSSTSEKKRKELTEIRRRKKQVEELVAQIQNSIRELEKHLDLATSSIFEKFKGKLPCPLAKCRVMRQFGIVNDPVYGTNFRNPGVDLYAKAGEKVKSVADGVVAFAGWLPGYQNVVIIKHEGGYHTVYGNLGSMKVKASEEISQGTILGIVSSHSWLDETPKLHFEVRSGKNAVNPLAWLK